jgi:hypothetical protein
MESTAPLNTPEPSPLSSFDSDFESMDSEENEHQEAAAKTQVRALVDLFFSNLGIPLPKACQFIYQEAFVSGLISASQTFMQEFIKLGNQAEELTAQVAELQAKLAVANHRFADSLVPCSNCKESSRECPEHTIKMTDIQ